MDISKKDFKVSIISVFYNAKKYIKPFFNSLDNQKFDNMELIIIDNGSTDGTKEALKNLYREKDFQFINNKSNIGFAEGNNLGIEKAKGEYILLLNPDVILEENYLEEIEKYLDKHQDIGAVTGKILKYKLENKKVVHTNIIDTKGLRIYKSHRVVEIGADKKNQNIYQHKKEVFGVSAAAAVYRKKALDDIKESSYDKSYFDDSFFIYKEDIDLSWRIRHQGWKLCYLPNAVAYHDRWETGSAKDGKHIVANRKTKSDLVNYYSYRNHLLLILKNEFLINLIIYLPAIIFYEIKKFIYLLMFERKTLRGLCDFFKLLPLTLRRRNAILSKSKIKPSDIRRWF